MTFEPHPLEVVNPQAAPPLLTTGAERREMLAQLPLDYVLFLRFDRRLAASDAGGSSCDQVLLERCQMRELVIGHDHGFGRGRSGDVETLRRLGADRGFDVDVVEVVDVGEQHVSSSPDPPRRRRRRSGHGRPDAGPPVSGERPGGARRAAGPAAGRADDQSRRAFRRRSSCRPTECTPCGSSGAAGRAGGMMNQGPKPTFQDGRRSLEAHLFDFDGDLYGEWVRIEWVERLRDVERFASVEALQQQLERDRIRARAVLAAAGPAFSRRPMPETLI